MCFLSPRGRVWRGVWGDSGQFFATDHFHISKQDSDVSVLNRGSDAMPLNTANSLIIFAFAMERGLLQNSRLRC